MDAADGNGAAPPELRLAWSCERWNCLPEAGAYLDQDYQLMQRMNGLSNIYATVAHLRSLQGAQIHTLTTNERNIIRWLMNEGVM